MDETFEPDLPGDQRDIFGDALRRQDHFQLHTEEGCRCRISTPLPSISGKVLSLSDLEQGIG